MPALEISRSMLVNRGLSAGAALGGVTAEMADAAAPALTDMVASFKKFVVDDKVAVFDQALAGQIATFSSPLDLATFFINAKYTELGGAAGFLGTTSSAVVATPGGTGFMRSFQHGSIYWHPQVGAHELHGPIRVRWQELGGDKSFLGFPTSDVTAGSDVRSEGFFAHFQGGSIYWAPLPKPLVLADTVLASAASTTKVGSFAAIDPVALAATAQPLANGLTAQPALTSTALLSDRLRSTVGDTAVLSTKTGGSGAVKVDTQVGVGIGIIKDNFETSAGAFEVHGAIRDKYLALGAEASILGYPRTDETGTPDGIGRFNHFQGGSIYWTPGTSAHEVHGLIRDRWASLGWERNPQLGYPLTDELIPDPRVGHRRPEVRKKPILAMPSDMLKLPADAAAAGFPATVINTPKTTAASTVAAPAATTRTLLAARTATSLSGAVGKLSDKSTVAVDVGTSIAGTQLPVSVALDPGLVSVIVGSTGPASTPADQRSLNRFADFESGVLFWLRGATSASMLAPLAATSDGTSLSFSGADIATAAMAKIGRPTFEGANMQLASMTFVGTTGYSFDGAQVHNRRHRLQLILQGIETHTISGPLGMSISQAGPVTATVELQVEVWFDASQRRIVLAPVDWSLSQAGSSSYAAGVSSAMRAKLDPLLWTSFELMTLPDTDGGAPIAVLSVKTLSNGAVAIFVEPHHNLVLATMGSVLANAVAPSVLTFTQPN